MRLVCLWHARQARSFEKHEHRCIYYDSNETFTIILNGAVTTQVPHEEVEIPLSPGVKYYSSAILQALATTKAFLPFACREGCQRLR
jgi:hypothetical protein